MPGQERLRKPAQKREREAAGELPARSDEEREAKRKRDAELDDLLDDIEEVLVDNAQQFVEGFVQKGGE